MKQVLLITLITGSAFLSCSKKSTVAPTPTSTNIFEYDFSANGQGKFVMNYYDGVSLGSAQTITVSSWSRKVTIPDGTTTANIFFTAGQTPPYNNTTGTVTIKLNGKIVAKANELFTSTGTLAEASYTYNATNQ